MTPLPFGACIKQLRIKRGMSLRALADKAGCTKPHLWEMENGHSSNPTIGTLSGLSKALGVPLARLVAPWAVDVRAALAKAREVSSRDGSPGSGSGIG